MGSMIIDLQKETFKTDQSVSVLLRKAFAVAVKLKVPEFEKWINNEINGYYISEETPPDYRKVNGEIKGFNPYNGWIPMQFEDPELAKNASERILHDPISNIETIITSSKKHMFFLPLPQEIQNKLSESTGFPTQYSFTGSTAQLACILDAVRKIVLDWALNLEKDGILGEDMRFNDDEKIKAERMNHTINNYYGDISNSQIQQNTLNSSQYQNIETIDKEEILHIINNIEKNVPDFELSEENSNEVIDQIEILKGVVNSDPLSKSVIKKSLTSIRTILEGVTGSLAAAGILYLISQVQI